MTNRNDLLDEDDVPDVDDLELFRSIDLDPQLLAPSGLPTAIPGYPEHVSHPASSASPEPRPEPTPTTPNPLDGAPAHGVPVVTGGPSGIDPGDEVFWEQVSILRGLVADRIAKVADDFVPGSEDERGAGAHVIQEVVLDHSQGLLSLGTGDWNTDEQRRLREALMAQQFGLGRLQAYVDDERVENIEVYSHKKVALIHTDGTVRWVGPIARSNAELREMISSLAIRHGSSFTPARPQLFLSLPGKVRLTAIGYGHVPDDETHVFLRMQRLRDVSLQRLVEVGEIDTVLRDFLSAAVIANKTIVVSGQGQGSGKTTMVKALALEIPEFVHVVTVESDFELYLPEARPRTHQMRALPPSGEDLNVIPTTADLTGASLRANADRIIAGEVRTADEIEALVRAMQGGNGTLTTLHADSAGKVLDVLTNLIGANSGSVEFARREVAQLVHLVVYLGVDIDQRTGKRHRYVREVLEIEPGEGGEPATQPIFKAGANRRAVPTGIISDTLRGQLAQIGYDANALVVHDGTGTWGQA